MAKGAGDPDARQVCHCCGAPADEVTVWFGMDLCPECFVQLQERTACPNGRCSG